MAEDDAELFNRDDPQARAELAQRYDDLAGRLASRFRGRGQDLDDLRQVARLGLVNAINRFDLEFGVAFSTFATRTIVGELKRHLRDKAWSVRVPRALQERSLEVGRAVQDLTQKLGRSPTLKEIASSVEASVEDVIEALEAGNAYSAASMEAPTGGDDDSRTLADTLGGDDPLVTRGADRVAVSQAMAQLPERERDILYKRFFEGLTQSEIAESVGLSQMHVSRLLRSSLETLRTTLSED